MEAYFDQLLSRLFSECGLVSALLAVAVIALYLALKKTRDKLWSYLGKGDCNAPER